MNPLPPKTASTDDAIETAAAEWLCERDEGFAPGRAQAFAAWRAADPRHEAAVAETERAMEIIAEMPAVRAPLEARIAAEARPVVLDGKLAVANLMTVTLSVDHRVTEGAVAARWLAAFRSRLAGLSEADVWLPAA